MTQRVPKLSMQFGSHSCLQESGGLPIFLRRGAILPQAFPGYLGLQSEAEWLK
jgi:hypothetical protein